MLRLPLYINAGFVAVTLLTVVLFGRAAQRSGRFYLIAAAWLIVQGALALSGFYSAVQSTPPRFVLAVLPPLAALSALFALRSGRAFLDALDLRMLTLLHVVRIPVEMLLWSLYLNHFVPGLMTFEGGNPDILSGISAVILICTRSVGRRARRRLLIAWNIVCLVLLINIVARAILSAPFSFQQIAFSQPNTALFYFPFIWLPAGIVPLVLLAHLAALRQLLKGRAGFAGYAPARGDEAPTRS